MGEAGSYHIDCASCLGLACLRRGISYSPLPMGQQHPGRCDAMSQNYRRSVREPVQTDERLLHSSAQTLCYLHQLGLDSNQCQCVDRFDRSVRCPLDWLPSKVSWLSRKCHLVVVFAEIFARKILEMGAVIRPSQPAVSPHEGSAHVRPSTPSEPPSA